MSQKKIRELSKIIEYNGFFLGHELKNIPEHKNLPRGLELHAITRSEGIILVEHRKVL